MKLSLFLLAALAAAPALAADKPLFLSGGPSAEDALRRFVDRDPRLKAKLDEAARRQEALLAAGRDPDLRDSVSDAGGPDELKRRIAQASGPGRAALISQLPGLQAPPAPTCPALTECAAPEFSATAADAAAVPETLRRMVRPWILLQAARGSKVELTPAEGEGDAVLNVGLKGLSAAGLTLNVAPDAAGGFKVWFGRPQEVASLYARERDAALKFTR